VARLCDGREGHDLHGADDGGATISGISSLVGGVAAAAVGRNRFASPLLAGLILLLPFGYYHLTMIWDKFPIWYHLTFLISLPVLSIIGGRFVRAQPA
jgi:hypothetical protein